MNSRNRTENDSFLIIVNPDELSFVKVILSELSIINSTSTNSDKIHIYNNLIIEYTRLILYLIRQNKAEEFIMLTEWVSNQIENAAEIFEQDLVTVFVSDVLVKFKKQLIFSKNLSIYNSFATLMDPVLEKFELTYRNR